MKPSKLHSKNALLLHWGYSFIILLVWGILLKDVLFVIAGLWICADYFRVVLLSRPWGSLNSHERRTRRFEWSFIVTMAAFFTFDLFITYFVDIAMLGRLKKLFLELALLIIIYFFLYNKKSEQYLEIALKEGGFRL
jgi:hypothetical protein